MQFIEVNNLSYACQTHQRDEHLPWLLMLHGFMGNHRVFDHLTDELCKFCNPITIDLLGHGQTSKPTDPARYDENRQISDILQLVDILDIHPLLFFGYSMGGRLALKTAINAPHIFDGLILESANCGIPDTAEREQRQTLDARWATEIEDDFRDFLSGWKKLDLFQSPVPTDQSLNQKYQDIQSEQSPKALAASLRGFGTGSMTPVCNKLKQLDLPILLLAGSADEKYQQINRYLSEQLPNATFSSVKAGHRTHLDNPTAFVRCIRNYTDRIDF